MVQEESTLLPLCPNMCSVDPSLAGFRAPLWGVCKAVYRSLKNGSKMSGFSQAASLDICLSTQ